MHWKVCKCFVNFQKIYFLADMEMILIASDLDK